ncbi:MAG: hypothetical protein ACI31B_06090 [Muribaculaceae bacterium]
MILWALRQNALQQMVLRFCGLRGRGTLQLWGFDFVGFAAEGLCSFGVSILWASRQKASILWTLRQNALWQQASPSFSAVLQQMQQKKREKFGNYQKKQ